MRVYFHSLLIVIILICCSPQIKKITSRSECAEKDYDQIVAVDRASAYRELFSRIGTYISASIIDTSLVRENKQAYEEAYKSTRIIKQFSEGIIRGIIETEDKNGYKLCCPKKEFDRLFSAFRFVSYYQNEGKSLSLSDAYRNTFLIHEPPKGIFGELLRYISTSVNNSILLAPGYYALLNEKNIVRDEIHELLRILFNTNFSMNEAEGNIDIFSSSIRPSGDYLIKYYKVKDISVLEAFYYLCRYLIEESGSSTNTFLLAKYKEYANKISRVSVGDRTTFFDNKEVYTFFNHISKKEIDKNLWHNLVQSSLRIVTKNGYTINMFSKDGCIVEIIKEKGGFGLDPGNISVTTAPANICTITENSLSKQETGGLEYILNNFNYIGPFEISVSINLQKLFDDRIHRFRPLFSKSSIQMLAQSGLERQYSENNIQLNSIKNNKIWNIYLSDTGQKNWYYYLFNLLMSGTERGKVQYLPVFRSNDNKPYTYNDWLAGFKTTAFSTKENYILLMISTKEPFRFDEISPLPDLKEKLQNTAYSIATVYIDADDS